MTAKYSHDSLVIILNGKSYNVKGNLTDIQSYLGCRDEAYIDTDVIISFLTGDDLKKQAAAAALFEQIEKASIQSLPLIR